jgi:hypothetical protein
MNTDKPTYKLDLESFIDLMIKDANDYGKINFPHVFYEVEKRSISHMKDGDFINDVNRIINGKYNYAISKDMNSNEFVLTPVGKLAKEKGGHKAYQLFVKEQHEKEDEIKELDYKLKKITINNSSLQRNISIASFLIACLSLTTTIIVSVSKSDKQYIPLQEMQQLQKTQEQINKSVQSYLDDLSKHQNRSDSMK